jgi:PAS domain-containing protein
MILYTFISMLFNPLRTFLCLAKYLTEVQGSVFIHEKSGRILFANPYFRKKLQYRNRELMLKKYEDIMHPRIVTGKHTALYLCEVLSQTQKRPQWVE